MNLAFPHSPTIRYGRESYRKKVPSLMFDVILNTPLPKFFKICVLKNFAIFTGKQLCWSLALVKRLQHRCLPVNIPKFLRTDIYRRILNMPLSMTVSFVLGNPSKLKGAESDRLTGLTKWEGGNVSCKKSVGNQKDGTKWVIVITIVVIFVFMQDSQTDIFKSDLEIVSKFRF